ncbi:hypothetical protein TRFO_22198 [Tritrichomonas foetus]|uniref:Uncharacterized protein n=1 Tax=Tritrichomonas foetus TaxID=1144522 RepID=A0A1J4KDP7_9EUKA|nr:hypothetical protein TRFO_22198 [Tritrichomonas foetus]|eukprot:OHT09040.1 hypothetical protein TRFO_22198 [Tritrichomonas foetus]
MQGSQECIVSITPQEQDQNINQQGSVLQDTNYHNDNENEFHSSFATISQNTIENPPIIQATPQSIVTDIYQDILKTQSRHEHLQQEETHHSGLQNEQPAIPINDSFQAQIDQKSDTQIVNDESINGESQIVESQIVESSQEVPLSHLTQLSPLSPKIALPDQREMSECNLTLPKVNHNFIVHNSQPQNSIPQDLDNLDIPRPDPSIFESSDIENENENENANNIDISINQRLDSEKESGNNSLDIKLKNDLENGLESVMLHQPPTIDEDLEKEQSIKFVQEEEARKKVLASFSCEENLDKSEFQVNNSSSLCRAKVTPGTGRVDAPDSTASAAFTQASFMNMTVNALKEGNMLLQSVLERLRAIRKKAELTLIPQDMRVEY